MENFTLMFGFIFWIALVLVFTSAESNIITFKNYQHSIEQQVNFKFIIIFIFLLKYNLYLNINYSFFRLLFNLSLYFCVMEKNNNNIWIYVYNEENSKIEGKSEKVWIIQLRCSLLSVLIQTLYRTIELCLTNFYC